MALFLYRFLKIMLFPLIFVIVAWRMFRGREDRDTFFERLGNPETPRPAGTLLWFHGASVGEVVSLQPVLREVRRRKPGVALLLTTGTTNGRKMLTKFAPTLPGTGAVVVQYAPLDTSGAVKGFLKHWQPALSVFAESEFWPELLSRAPRPILLNGRISDRSWPRYQRWKWLFRPLLSRFDLCLAQSAKDAERLRQLGARNVHVGGNLKFDADPLPADATQLEKFRHTLAERPVLVAASTHPGEEEQVAQLHMALKPAVPELLTIIVPRHPHRGTQAVNDVQRFTKAVKRRGLGEMPVLGGPRHTDIYVADTLGELGLWYRLANVVLIGGSLVRHGGHNPLEPLKMGVPTLAGPHMFNFQDMLPTLTEKGLLTIAPDVPTLARNIQSLLSDAGKMKTQRALIAEQMPRIGGSAQTAANTIAALLPNA